LLLLLKFNSLVVLPAPYRWSILITTPVLARWAITWVMVRYPLARKEGLGVLFVTGAGWQQVILASVIAAGTALIAFGPGGLILLGVAWFTATLVAMLAMARIGGLTGDIYGATCELTETILLVVAFPTMSGFS